MGLGCFSYAVIPKKLTRDIIEKIILNGLKINNFRYRKMEIPEGSGIYKEQTAQEIAEQLYKKLLSTGVYASLFGYIGTEQFYVLLSIKESHFQLSEDEFEIRINQSMAPFSRQFRNCESEVADLEWYTNILLEMTKGLPIKQLQTLLI